MLKEISRDDQRVTEGKVDTGYRRKVNFKPGIQKNFLPGSGIGKICSPNAAKKPAVSDPLLQAQPMQIYRKKGVLHAPVRRSDLGPALARPNKEQNRDIGSPMKTVVAK